MEAFPKFGFFMAKQQPMPSFPKQAPLTLPGSVRRATCTTVSLILARGPGSQFQCYRRPFPTFAQPASCRNDQHTMSQDTLRLCLHKETSISLLYHCTITAPDNTRGIPPIAPTVVRQRQRFRPRLIKVVLVGHEAPEKQAKERGSRRHIIEDVNLPRYSLLRHSLMLLLCLGGVFSSKVCWQQRYRHNTHSI